jgi:glutathione peroxidase
MDIYGIEVRDIDGKTVRLDRYRGEALLVVNVASQCGYTPQYRGLEALHRQYHAQGFEVLGFPCDQFGHQEPGDEAQIREFCSVNYGVSFPMFAKLEVNGAGAHPLYQFLKAAKPGLLGTEAIKWNFTKFLVARDGAVLQRFAPADAPESLGGAIEKALAVPRAAAATSG